MSADELRAAVCDRGSELLELWLEEHLASAPVRADESIIRSVHRRSRSFVRALERALSSDDADDWGSFAHREVVQVFTMMVHALAEGKATAGAAGGLAPSLGRALERLCGSPTASIVLPLAEIAAEAFTAAQLASQSHAYMERLARTTPILKLRSGTLLVAACGSPNDEAAQTIVDRVLRAVIKLEASAPTVIVDLSSLETVSTSAMAVLMSLPFEVTGLGGVCGVTGLPLAQREVLEEQGVDMKGVNFYDNLAESLAALLPGGLLRRLGRALR